jgi:hypothetical protein
LKILHVVQYVFEDLPGGIQKFVSELSMHACCPEGHLSEIVEIIEEAGGMKL